MKYSGGRWFLALGVGFALLGSVTVQAQTRQPPVIPPGQAQIDPQEVDRLMKKIMSDPESMKLIQNLQNDPNMQNILNNPEVLDAVNRKDAARLKQNSDIQSLQKNQDVQKLMERLK